MPAWKKLITVLLFSNLSLIFFLSMNIDKINERINSIKTSYPMYDELLTFFEKIVTKQYEFKPQISIGSFVPDIEESKAKKKIEECIPLLEDEEFEIDFSSTSQLFDALGEIAKSQNKHLRDEIQKIERTLKKQNLKSPTTVPKESRSMILRNGVGLQEELFHKVAHNNLDYIDKISNEFSLNKEVLTLLTLNSVKPSIELIAHRLKNLVNMESWSGISCPICGSPPAISFLRGEEGRRILSCSFCSTEWQGRRMICYHCGNSEYQTLRYFYTQEDDNSLPPVAEVAKLRSRNCQTSGEEEKYRIDVCDKCKHYLKTFDSRKFDGEIIPPVEDIATLHLDILAAGEGYKRIDD
ncbi:formate dehydrogenase accessory protein FdhE [Candidatus Poribacteria bacterium]|nr:formate dehydrogenase accessory protein FdhE [Candidatus Poribacteria bacterium]